MNQLKTLLNENINPEIIFNTFFINNNLRPAYLVDVPIMPSHIDLLTTTLKNIKAINTTFGTFILFKKVDFDWIKFNNQNYQIRENYIGQLLGYLCPGDASKVLFKSKVGISIQIIYNSMNISIVN